VGSVEAGYGLPGSWKDPPAIEALSQKLLGGNAALL
jgi:hypothetical protein